MLAVLIAGVGASETKAEESKGAEPKVPEVPVSRLEISINLAEHYITCTGDSSNFYKVDENKVLWGSGRNKYGQLSQGVQDTAVYDDKFYSRLFIICTHEFYPYEGEP